MAYYVLTDGKDHFIRRDDKTKKYVEIGGLSYATKWDNKIAPDNILRSSINKEIRPRYRTVMIKEPVAKASAIENISHDTTADPDGSMLDKVIDEWIGKINEVKAIMSVAGNRRDVLYDDLSAIDKKIVDMEHYIEFGNFNAYQGWICFKTLQEFLRQRRVYKNEIGVLDIIGRSALNDNSLNKLTEAIKDSACKLYSPRAIPELFVPLPK